MNSSANDNSEGEYFDVTVDKNFLEGAITVAMQIKGELKDNEYLNIVYLEIENEHFNIVAKKEAHLAN